MIRIELMSFKDMAWYVTVAWKLKLNFLKFCGNF